MDKKVYAIVIMLCMILVGCGNEVTCEYESIKKSDLGQKLFENDRQFQIGNVMKEHSVKVKNQKLAVSEYEIKLDEYFYNRNTGVVAYKFFITSSGGNLLTDTQYEQLIKLHQNGDLELLTERSNRPIINKIQKENDGQAVWYNCLMLSIISPQDSSKDISDKQSLDLVELYIKGDKAGEFYLPKYNYNEEVIEFDISNNKEIISANMTENGLYIIWNIEDKLAEYKKMIKELPKGQSSEGYNYLIYSSIFVCMNDGTKYNVLDYFCDEEVREQNELAGFSAVWENSIPLEKVESIEIDCNKYYIKSNFAR